MLTLLLVLCKKLGQTFVSHTLIEVCVCVYLGPAAPSESWLPASLGVPADLVVGEMGGGAIQQ